MALHSNHFKINNYHSHSNTMTIFPHNKLLSSFDCVLRITFLYAYSLSQYSLFIAFFFSHKIYNYIWLVYVISLYSIDTRCVQRWSFDDPTKINFKCFDPIFQCVYIPVLILQSCALHCGIFDVFNITKVINIFLYAVRCSCEWNGEKNNIQFLGKIFCERWVIIVWWKLHNRFVCIENWNRRQ